MSNIYKQRPVVGLAMTDFLCLGFRLGCWSF